MKIYKKYTLALLATFGLIGCAENELAVEPKHENFPFRLILDAEEGGDLPDAEDYDLAIKFADFIGDLPDATVTVDYEISDLTGDMVGAVTIDKVIYEVDDEEVELDFTVSADGLSGIITLNDPTTGELPEEIEVVFVLPGEEETFYASGGFKFSISNLQADEANVLLGTPNEFEYEVLDHELAGTWEMELSNAEAFDDFKEAFEALSPELADMDFSDVKTGEAVGVEIEFELEEVNIIIAYINEVDEEVEFEIEAEYDFEDGEIELEGSRIIIGDDGEIEDELDFMAEGEYELDGDEVTITIFKIIDEDNYEEGEELFASETGYSIVFTRD